MTIRCLVVDDSPHFLEVARGGLSRNGIEVVGTASNSADALDEARRLHPDVVLVDVSLGEESGFDLARRLADLPGSQPRVVLTSTYAEDDLAEQIAASPVVGFIPKSRLSAEAVQALLD